MPSAKNASQKEMAEEIVKPMIPTREEVLAARLASGLTQIEAAAAVHLRSFSRWSEYERGERNMDSARYELFLIKTGQHPEFMRRKRMSKAQPSPPGQEDDAGNVPRSN